MLQYNILLIADEEVLILMEQVFKKAFPTERYRLHSIIDKFDSDPNLRNHPLVKGRNGPLNAETMEALIMNEGPNMYDGALVDLRCDDLIEPLRKAGYKNPIIIFGGGSRHSEIPFIRLEVPNISETLDKTFMGYLK